jgi:hypothetical protein
MHEGAFVVRSYLIVKPISWMQYYNARDKIPFMKGRGNFSTPRLL